MQCPMDYALDFDGEPTFHTQTLYVVGGLYGNKEALHAIKQLIEPDALMVFNGDIHWFDRDVELFAQIEALMEPYVLLNGNVEMELSREIKSGAGCGCFYPECVSESTKQWAHEIHAELRTMVDVHLPLFKQQFQKRQTCLRVWVGETKVAITHGDETSLAGWGCSVSNLESPQRKEALNHWFKAHDVRVLASSHTCEAALLALQEGVVINNGAAGLPNFQALGSGLITRIGTTPTEKALYGTRYDGLYIDAIDVAYDAHAFEQTFRSLWDATSPAFRSYIKRITQGVKREPYEAIVRP